MKIRIVETEIEADARELRECNTLADNFSMMLSRVFQNREPLDDIGGTEDEQESRCEDGD